MVQCAHLYLYLFITCRCRRIYRGVWCCLQEDCERTGVIDIVDYLRSTRRQNRCNMIMISICFAVFCDAVTKRIEPPVEV